MKAKLIVYGLLLSVLAWNEVEAQYVFVPDQTGKPLTDARYEDITGTPYLLDTWVNGEVKLANGQLVKPPALKFDMVTDKLLFQADEKIYEFFPRAAAFSLHTPAGIKTFLWKDDDSKNSGYYELLSDGKIKFLKRTKKSILEVKGYNSANIQKTVDENNKYFIIYEGVETEVKLNRKSFAEALPSFKNKILNYNAQNRKSAEQTFIELLGTLNEI